jgi:ParB family chromosome partitioning protein
MNENLAKGGSIFFIELEKIEPNPYQPRIEFDQNKLEALADSIRQYGVLQPIVVTRKEEYSEEFGIRTKYQIIAGERRFRASKIAGLNQIPAIIRDGKETDSEKLELAIIENLQREDLNPVDKAKAFRKLADNFGLTHAVIAKKMGKSREYVSNAMRILMLPENMLAGLMNGNITEGHTRSLLMLKDRPEEQKELYSRIVNDKLTVRAAEKIARSVATDKIRKRIDTDPEIKKIESHIRNKLGTKVTIDQKPIGDGGKLTIEYFNKNDLKKILEIIENSENNLVSSEVAEESKKEEFASVEPTVFREEIEKIEQFGNIVNENSISQKQLVQEDDFNISVGDDVQVENKLDSVIESDISQNVNFNNDLVSEKTNNSSFNAIEKKNEDSINDTVNSETDIQDVVSEQKDVTTATQNLDPLTETENQTSLNVVNNDNSSNQNNDLKPEVVIDKTKNESRGFLQKINPFVKKVNLSVPASKSVEDNIADSVNPIDSVMTAGDGIVNDSFLNQVAEKDFNYQSSVSKNTETEEDKIVRPASQDVDEVNSVVTNEYSDLYQQFLESKKELEEKMSQDSVESDEVKYNGNTVKLDSADNIAVEKNKVEIPNDIYLSDKNDQFGREEIKIDADVITADSDDFVPVKQDNVPDIKKDDIASKVDEDKTDKDLDDDIYSFKGFSI